MIFEQTNFLRRKSKTKNENGVHFIHTLSAISIIHGNMETVGL